VKAPIRDFDGTLAWREGMWRGAEAAGLRAILVRRSHPEAGLVCKNRKGIAQLVDPL